MILFLLFGCGEQVSSSQSTPSKTTTEIIVPKELLGSWSGLEPIADSNTGWVRFDRSATERPIGLELRADGTATGAARLIAFGRNSDNSPAEFNWRVEGQKLIFQKKNDVVPLRFFYFLPNPNELQICPTGTSLNSPYGKVHLFDEREILTIEETRCSHQHNKQAEPYTAPCAYREQGDHSVLSYKAKDSAGNIHDRTLHYYPEHKIILSPPGYILLR